MYGVGFDRGEEGLVEQCHNSNRNMLILAVGMRGKLNLKDVFFDSRFRGDRYIDPLFYTDM